MKRTLVLMIICFSVSLFSGHVLNPDRPLKGTWDFKVQRIWEASGGGGELLIRVGHIDTDREGNVYLMELKHGRIFKFSGNGKFVTTIGKQGEGPGEFRMAFRFHIVNDEIIVPENGGRIQYFDRNGTFLRQVNPGTFVFPNVFIDKDRFVTVKSDREGQGKEPERISIYDLRTGESRDIREIAPEELLTAEQGGMRLVIKDSQTTPGIVVTLQGDDILFGKSDKYNFSRIDLNGKEISSFSIEGRKRKPISEKFKRKRFENISLNGGRMPKEMVDQMVKGMPDQATCFSRIMTGEGGYLYVFVSDLQNEVGQEIDIFSPDGKYLYRGELRVEEGSKLTSGIAFHKDSAFMFVEDEEGESALVKYKITLPR